MPQSEFEIISQYFRRPEIFSPFVQLGIGDDAALVSHPADDQLLAVAIDTLVAGTHFLGTHAPEDIAYKALAVNLSDLAAMGATPAWFTLALTLPESSTSWLSSFAQGLFELAQQYQIDLIGGDTTRGPLSITIQIAGYVQAMDVMRRDGAGPGDYIYVTGTLGDAALALQCQANADISISADARDKLFSRLYRPTPRVAIGKQIAKVASTCIDISDGLLADLAHILDASHVGASIHMSDLPLSKSFRQTVGEDMKVRELAATGGDDYELCFCVPEGQLQTWRQMMETTDVPCTCIGRIESEPGLRCLNNTGEIIAINKIGYQHFD